MRFPRKLGSRRLLVGLCVATYIGAPAFLILFGGYNGFVGAMLISFPLSVVALPVAFLVAGLTLDSTDSNGLPIAAFLMSLAATTQALFIWATVCVVRRRVARRRSRKEAH